MCASPCTAGSSFIKCLVPCGATALRSEASGQLNPLPVEHHKQVSHQAKHATQAALLSSALPPPLPCRLLQVQTVNFKLVPVEYQLLVVNLFTILGDCLA